MPQAFKFDFFPAAAFPLGRQELDRAVLLNDTGLTKAPVPFVTPEDILLAKLFWYRLGGDISEVQWRDLVGVIHNYRESLDQAYLQSGADTLKVSNLLDKLLAKR